MSFAISRRRRLMTRLYRNHSDAMLRAAALESNLLRDRIQSQPVTKPVFVTGLARSGTTRMLMALNEMPELVSHRYCDQAGIFTPYWWQTVLRHGSQHRDQPEQQRAHGDGIPVGPQSPEAFEEILWQTAWPGRHDPDRSAVLDQHARNPGFAQTYLDHIRKLVMARGGSRYLAKNNYNLTRLSYLARLLPDARFVVMVRQPAAHVASLIRQDRRFREQQDTHPDARAYLSAIGHHEFGYDQVPIHTGCDDIRRRARDLWQKGETVRAWGAYWAALYGRVLDDLNHDPWLARRVHLVRVENIRQHPHTMLDSLVSALDLKAGQDTIERMADPIRPPQACAHQQLLVDDKRLRAETDSVARMLGY